MTAAIRPHVEPATLNSLTINGLVNNVVMTSQNGINATAAPSPAITAKGLAIALGRKAYELVVMDSNVDMVLIWLTMLNPRYKDLIKLQEISPKPIAIVSAMDVNVSPDCFSDYIKRAFVHFRAKKIPNIIKDLNQKMI